MSGCRWFIRDKGQTTLNILRGIVCTAVYALESDKMEFGF